MNNNILTKDLNTSKERAWPTVPNPTTKLKTVPLECVGVILITPRTNHTHEVTVMKCPPLEKKRSATQDTYPPVFKKEKK